MLRKLASVMTSRAAGPAASIVAAGLAMVLALAWSGWRAERSALEGRIAELNRQGERSQALWKAQLNACHAAAVDARRLTDASYGARGAGADPRRLLDRQPEGFDACARMESADQAVLSNLK